MTNGFWVGFVIENSVIVIVLALIAEGITRWSKNARIASLLWLVVLVKFMIPSFLFCELPLLPTEQPSRESHSIVRGQDFSKAEVVTPTTALPVEMPTPPNLGIANASKTESSERTSTSRASQGLIGSSNATSWTSVIGALWLCGSIVWFGNFALRLDRFRLGLHASERANDSLQRLSKQIAMKFRLFHAPEIRVIDGAISPILWSCGWNARIILPPNMIKETSNDGMTAVLVHEIAHLKRLDHWVQRLA